MSGVLSMGKQFCDFVSPYFLFHQQICSLPTTQRAFLLGGVGVAIGSVFTLKYVRKSLHAHAFQKLYGNDPIAMAQYGNRQGMKQYIASGGDVNVVDPVSGNTPLTMACEKGHFGIVQDLLKSPGVLIDCVNKNDETALHLACSGRFDSIVDLLLQKKVNHDVKDKNGNTPLMEAAKRGAESIVKRLIREKCNLDQENFKKQTALHLAVEHSKIVQLLLDAGADSDLQDKEDWTPLHVAAHQEYVGSIPLLLQKMKNPNVQDKEGNTALHLTALHIHGRPKSAAVLLKDNKINPNLLNQEGMSPFHIACLGMAGNYDLARVMLRSNRFDLSLKSSGETKETGFQLAARKNNENVDQEFLQELSRKQKNEASPYFIQEDSVWIPREAAWENGDKIEECDLKKYSKDQLEKLRVGDLTLVEWAIIDDNSKVIKALQKKGIFFEFTKENEKRLIVGLFKHLFEKQMDKFCMLPVKEVNQYAAEIKEFLVCPDLENPKHKESVKLWIETARSYFTRRQIITYHQKEGTHTFGREYFCISPEVSLLFQKWKAVVGSDVLAKFENFHSIEEIMDELDIPEERRFLFRTERTLEELVKFWPCLVEIKR